MQQGHLALRPVCLSLAAANLPRRSGTDLMHAAAMLIAAALGQPSIILGFVSN